MNILFLHPNFPSQYLNLAAYFGRDSRHKVYFLAKDTNGVSIPGVNLGVYKVQQPPKGTHPYIKPIEAAVLEGQAVARALVELRQKVKFVPDVIVAHTGWGSALYVKDLYPEVPLIGYFEWYYHAFGSDVGYWPSDLVTDNDKLRIRTLNAHHLLNLTNCDVLYTPTEWQRQQFPTEFRDRMKVIHEGVDTSYHAPDPEAKLVLEKPALDLSAAEEIVTYVSRGLEPYRGFPQFMDAVRLLLKRRPKCHVVVIGADRTCYGAKPKIGNPPKETTWLTLEKRKAGFDTKRVHFTGPLSHADYLKVLQASTVHVYLTRPFVLSWSLLESMSIGCCLVSSATPPVEEVIEDGVNGLLANFQAPEQIAERIEEALEKPELRARLGRAARATVIERYELKDCMRKLVNMIYGAMK